VVLEGRQVCHRITDEVSRGARSGVRGERSRNRVDRDGRMLIEIAERVDGGHAKSGARRGFGGRPSRYACNKHVLPNVTHCQSSCVPRLD
jgi:hypothetical protein